MNPAHVFLISLAVLAVFWLGVYCGSDEHDDDVAPYLFLPAILLNLTAAGFLIASLYRLIIQAL